MVLNILVNIFLGLLCGFFPLYMEDSYFNIDEAKWNCFRVLCYGTKYKGIYIPGAIPIIGVACIIYFVIAIINKKKFRKPSLEDFFVLGYLIVVLISSYNAINPEKTLLGHEHWWMGLASQLAFIAIYFFTSRFWKSNEIFWGVFFAVTTFVFGVAVINRFWIYPFNMVPTYIKRSYLLTRVSTIGHNNWYSGYLAILAPLGIAAYMSTKKWYFRILSWLFCIVVSATWITVDADSVFLALVPLTWAMLWYGSRKEDGYLRWLELAITMLATWKVIGYIQVTYPDRAMELEPLSTFCSQSKLMFIPLIFFAVVYVIMRILYHTDHRMSQKARTVIFVIYTILLVLAGITVIAYVYLNTKGLLPKKYSSTNKFLVFDQKWGTNRGALWRLGVETIKEMFKNNPLRLLFGAGPDQSWDAMNRYASELVANTEYAQHIVVQNVHMEIMNHMICYGLLGAVAYAGIRVNTIISAMKRIVKDGKEREAYNSRNYHHHHRDTSAWFDDNWIVVAGVLCMCCFLGNQIVSFQDVVVAPFMFMIAGMVDHMLNHEKIPEKHHHHRHHSSHARIEPIDEEAQKETNIEAAQAAASAFAASHPVIAEDASADQQKAKEQ